MTEVSIPIRVAHAAVALRRMRMFDLPAFELRIHLRSPHRCSPFAGERENGFLQRIHVHT